LNARLAKAYFPLGLSLIKMGRFEDASVLLAKTTTDNPDYPSIQNQLGTGLWKLKKYAEATDFFKKAKQDHKIQTIIKPALESIGDLKNSKFDMIFIDADKMNYKEYYERSLDLLNKNSLIVIDNVLWHGEVVDEANNHKYTLNIREFNTYVSQDKRVEQIIVPLGDGMTVCRVL
jgi:predicted O-methyltransferase YrrM